MRGSGFAFHLSAASGHIFTDVVKDARVTTSKAHLLASVPRLRAIGAFVFSLRVTIRCILLVCNS